MNYYSIRLIRIEERLVPKIRWYINLILEIPWKKHKYDSFNNVKYVKPNNESKVADHNKKKIIQGLFRDRNKAEMKVVVVLPAEVLLPLFLSFLLFLVTGDSYIQVTTMVVVIF